MCINRRKHFSSWTRYFHWLFQIFVVGTAYLWGFYCGKKKLIFKPHILYLEQNLKNYICNSLHILLKILSNTAWVAVPSPIFSIKDISCCYLLKIKLYLPSLSAQNSILKKKKKIWCRYYNAWRLRSAAAHITSTESLCRLRRSFIVSHPWETLFWIIFSHTFTYRPLTSSSCTVHNISIVHLALHLSALVTNTIHGSPLKTLKLNLVPNIP